MAQRCDCSRKDPSAAGTCRSRGWHWTAALVALAALALIAPVLAQAATYTVNSTADTPDVDLTDGACADANGACTLRAAIAQANATSNPSLVEPDTIAFALAGTPPFTIEPQFDLPVITDSVTIDGTTQCPACATPLVEIRNPGLATVEHYIGLQLATGDNTIRGLAIDGFVNNLLIQPFSTLPCDHCDDDNVIEDDYVGLDPNGLPRDDLSRGWLGVGIYGSSGNTIRNNRIAAVIGNLIQIAPGVTNGGIAYPTDNALEGNYIGTTTDGSALAPGLQGFGINLDHTVGTRIGGAGGGAGGACTGSCNLIASSPGLTGIVSNGDTDETIEGNFIGTNITGTEALSVSAGGVGMRDASHVRIERNLISGLERSEGIHLDLEGFAEGSSDVTIAGNYIGTDASGTKPLGNLDHGVWVGSPRAGEVTIGGGPLGSSCTGACNLISNTLDHAVIVGFGSALGPRVENVIVRGNFIGTDVEGRRVDGLRTGGVFVLSSSNTIEENLIYSSGSASAPFEGAVSVAGNDNTIERNVIAYSPVSAVGVASVPGWEPPCCSGNLIQSNRIFANGFGIDLLKPGACDGGVCGAGPTPNDLGDGDGSADGGNELQNFPVISSAVSGGGETTITYSLNSHPNTRYRLEFFANDACNGSYDPGFGEGQTVFGSTDITTDAAGNYSSTDSFPTPFGAGPVVTATATDPANNTSEFSACHAVEAGATLIVEKQTLPDGDPASFSFSGDVSGTIGDGGTITVGSLAPGTYHSTERVPAGWVLDSISCDDSDSSGDKTTATATFQVAAGETVKCIFTDAKRGTIVVRKATRPAGDPATFPFTGDASGTIGDGGTITVGSLVPGDYSSTEGVPGGWDPTKIDCDDGASPHPSSGDLATATARFHLDPGETVTCTFTDTKRGTIVVKKETDPAGASGSFTFTGDAAGTIGAGGQISLPNLRADAVYHATEADPTPNFDLTSINCNDATSANPSSGDLASRTASFQLDPGETVTCTFTDTQRGTVSVRKTVSGSPISSLLPPAQQSFTFQLRQGASTTSAGTLIEQKDATVVNGGVVNFASKLEARSTYQLCEIVMPGWRTSLTTPFVLYNPSGDNSTLCTNFSVDPAEAKSITVDNQPPPGGLARTIGFWKNWASCASSSGNQKPVLDQTLAAAEPVGIMIGTLTLHGSTSSPSTAPDCLKAVRLLNKSTINTGKKMSSDPAFNLAAQLLAADLNVKAGALTCPSAISAINDAQSLLAAVHFNGITHDKLSAPQATQANSLASTLDRYNNNLLC